MTPSRRHKQASSLPSEVAILQLWNSTGDTAALSAFRLAHAAPSRHIRGAAANRIPAKRLSFN
jgi:hypothetical protein